VNTEEDRLGPAIRIITSLAKGDLHPDFPEITDDSELEAIVVGLQMLAEERRLVRRSTGAPRSSRS